MILFFVGGYFERIWAIVYCHEKGRFRFSLTLKHPLSIFSQHSQFLLLQENLRNLDTSENSSITSEHSYLLQTATESRV